MPAKVRCRTCHSDHDYRHEQAPPPKVDARKQALFNEVLKKVNPEEASAVVAELDDPPLEEAAAAAEAPETPAAPVAESKAKGKAKGKARTEPRA